MLHPHTRTFYCQILAVLNGSGVPYLIGGAYALGHYTGIERHTKDFDIFIRRSDYAQVMAVLSTLGCQTELTFPHWLGKAYCGDDFIDVIFSSGNALAPVDDEWFNHAAAGEVLGMPVKFCPPEEMIWSKAFVMERERYDGADIAHLFRVCAKRLDWERLFRRFGPHWRVLLSHLVLFGFVYPSERTQIPPKVMDELVRRLQAETHGPPPAERLCQGTLLSRAQYLIDIERGGYHDARLTAQPRMTAEEITHWTAAIGAQK